MLFCSLLCWLRIFLPLSLHCCPPLCRFVPPLLNVPSIVSQGLVTFTSQLGCRMRKAARTAQWSEALKWPEPQSDLKFWGTPIDPKAAAGPREPARRRAKRRDRPGTTGRGSRAGPPASHQGLTERTCCLRVLSPPYGASAVVHAVRIGTRKQDKENANSFSSGRRGSLLLLLPTSGTQVPPVLRNQHTPQIQSIKISSSSNRRDGGGWERWSCTGLSFAALLCQDTSFLIHKMHADFVRAQILSFSPLQQEG